MTDHDPCTENSTPLVYIVDDDADLLPALLEIVEESGWPALGFASGNELLTVLTQDWEGVILSDMRMPGLSGLELLEKVKARAPEVPFVLFTAHGDIPLAVQAIQKGAFDFLEKNAPGDYLRAVIRRALESRKLQLENRRLKARLVSGQSLKISLPGKSQLMRELRRGVAAVAALEAPVLLSGEAGSGKSRTAMLIHDISDRAGDFGHIDCATLTEENFDVVLKGAADQMGAIQRAAGGTLHLSRITGLPAAMQARLVKLIDTSMRDLRVRVIASAGPIADIRAAGQLRDDLYYRLSLAELELPPVRRREDDVFLLLDIFIREAMARHRRGYPTLSPQDLRPYRHYHWPGNLRELRNVAEKLVIGLRVVLQPSVEMRSPNLPPDELGYEPAMYEFESSLLQAALQKTGGRKAEAAEALGIPRKRLYLRLKACGLLDAGHN